MIVAARKGSPLLLGVGEDGHYAASDTAALLRVCPRGGLPQTAMWPS